MRHTSDTAATRTMIARLQWVLPAALAVLLGGCAPLLKQAPAYAIYDLGLVSAGQAAPQRFVPAAIEVHAPSWLASPAMQYRLEFAAPSPREAYVGSRWAGQPAEMVQRQLARLLSGGAGQERGSCRLRVELDEFVQSFESVKDSRAELRARATLLGPRGAGALAQRAFAVRVPAPTPDARGGVQAHRQAVQLFAGELSGWLDTLTRAGAGHEAVNQHCRN